MPPQRRVDYNSKTFLLTWSQTTELSKQIVLDFLLSKGELDGYIVAREAHQDGNFHHHAFVVYKEALRVRAVRFFDIQGHHPNISSPVRSYPNAWQYCAEDGDFITGGCLATKPTGSTKVSAWSYINESTTAEDLLTRVRERAPRDYWLSYDRLQASARATFAARPQAYTTPEGFSFVIPAELQDWVDTEFSRTDRPRSLVLVGPSRLGKTVWARSLGYVVKLLG